MEGGKTFLVLALVALLAFVGIAGYKSLKKSGTQAAPTGTPGQAVQTPAPVGSIAISIASSNTKEDWLHEQTKKFNEASKNDAKLQVSGKPVYVTILQEMIDGKPKDYRSGTMVTDILNKKIQPTIASPGEEAWILKLQKDWQIQHGSVLMKGDAPAVLVRTPIVVAMWQSRAKALGCWPTQGPSCTWSKIKDLAASPEGWKKYGHAEWGKFTFGYGYFGESNSGTLGLISICMVGAKKQKGLALDDVAVNKPCGRFMAAIELAKVHSGKSDVWLLEKMIKEGPEYLHGVITYESNVILMNRKFGQEMREPLVSFYPQDGTVVVGHPFAILNKAPWVTEEQAQAADLFGKFLLARDQQEAVLNLGLRPVDSGVKLGSPIEVSNGASPETKLVTIELPDTSVVEQIGAVWKIVKKPAYVAIVFDRSGSMGRNGKIGAAIKGAQEFVNRMDSHDYLIWIPHDDEVYYTKGDADAEGLKSKIGERLIERIGGISANGGTALYHAVLVAYKRLEELRKQHGDKVRYGIVVLSDGKDENSHRYDLTLSKLTNYLKPSEKDPSGIQIHTIAIGSDADEGVLKEIAKAAHGKFYKGKSAKDMIRVYADIATHY